MSPEWFCWNFFYKSHHMVDWGQLGDICIVCIPITIKTSFCCAWKTAVFVENSIIILKEFCSIKRHHTVHLYANRCTIVKCVKTFTNLQFLGYSWIGELFDWIPCAGIECYSWVWYQGVNWNTGNFTSWIWQLYILNLAINKSDSKSRISICCSDLRINPRCDLLTDVQQNPGNIIKHIHLFVVVPVYKRSNEILLFLFLLVVLNLEIILSSKLMHKHRTWTLFSFHKFTFQHITWTWHAQDITAHNRNKCSFWWLHIQ